MNSSSSKTVALRKRHGLFGRGRVGRRKARGRSYRVHQIQGNELEMGRKLPRKKNARKHRDQS